MTMVLIGAFGSLSFVHLASPGWLSQLEGLRKKFANMQDGSVGSHGRVICSSISDSISSYLDHFSAVLQRMIISEMRKYSGNAILNNPSTGQLFHCFTLLTVGSNPAHESGALPLAGPGPLPALLVLATQAVLGELLAHLAGLTVRAEAAREAAKVACKGGNIWWV